MCKGDPSICRCGRCFLASLQPKKYKSFYPVLGPGPFRNAVEKIEKEEKESKYKLSDFKFNYK